MIRLAALCAVAACAFDPTPIDEASLTIENATSWSIAAALALPCNGSGQASLLVRPLDAGATTTVYLDAGCYSLIASSSDDAEQWTEVKTITAGPASVVWRLTTTAAQSHEPGCGGPPP
ncbi:MAG TPA: hypothetical protein VH143_22390 [Kofleriaceae bacterium]|nr:hypothetical protein [Kofleriaceae bacterium]